jgi:hypothetical protein
LRTKCFKYEPTGDISYSNHNRMIGDFKENGGKRTRENIEK